LSGNHAHKVGVGRYASNKIIAYRMAAWSLLDGLTESRTWWCIRGSL